MPVTAFVIQVLLGSVAVVAGRWTGSRPRSVWAPAAVAGVVAALAALSTRLLPATAVTVLGAPLVACVEMTAWAIPTLFVLMIGSRHLPRDRDRRAMWLLAAVGGGFACKSGLWMVTPPLPAAEEGIVQAGVCRQTTGSTCVAASLTTMLLAHGVAATEAEMASLAMTDSGGASDARAVWALQRKLANTPLRPRYSAINAEALAGVPKPCVVCLRWGTLTSHMVAVMSMDKSTVTLGDPLSGARVVERKEFEQDWRGRAIWLTR